MVSLDMLNQLKVNTQNTEIKSNNPNASKYEINDKQTFKELLSKEFNERTINNTTKKSTASIESNEIKEGALEKEVVVDKKSLEEALNKVVELIDENSDKEKIDLDSISEVLILLSNLIHNKNFIAENHNDSNFAASNDNYSEINVMNLDSNKISSLTGNVQNVDSSIEKILNEISITENLSTVKNLLKEELVNSNNLEENPTLNLNFDYEEDFTQITKDTRSTKGNEVLDLLLKEDTSSAIKTMNNTEDVGNFNNLSKVKDLLKEALVNSDNLDSLSKEDIIAITETIISTEGVELLDNGQSLEKNIEEILRGLVIEDNNSSTKINEPLSVIKSFSKVKDLLKEALVNSDNLDSLSKEDIIAITETIISTEGVELLDNGQSLEKNIEEILRGLVIEDNNSSTKINEPLSVIKSFSEVKELLIEALENRINSDVNTTSNLKVNNINSKLIEILNLLPKDEITAITEKMSSTKKFEFLNALNNIKNNKEGSIVDNPDKLAILPTKIGDKENISYEATKEGHSFNLKEEITDEDKFLLKIIEEDDRNSFSNVLGSFNKVTLNPSDILVEPKEIHRQSFNSDIIQNVKYMIRNNVEELSIKIYPKELGELTIKIISEEGVMRAELKATSKETYNLLNSNLQEIKNNLQEQNIKIQEVSINIYNEDTTFFSGENRNSSNSQNSTAENAANGLYSEDEQEEVENIIMDNNLNILA